MGPTIGIPDNEKEKIASFLNILLADEYILYTKTRNVHWNVNWPNYQELHAFFENQYEALNAIIDDIAEWIRSLGRYALGSLNDFLKVTHMEEEKHDFNDPIKIIQTLVNDHEAIIHSIQNDIYPTVDKCQDFGTTDFLNRLIKQHEKMINMLKTFLS